MKEKIIITVLILLAFFSAASSGIVLYRVARYESRFEQHETILNALMKGEAPIVTEGGREIPLFGYILSEINKLKSPTPTPSPAPNPFLVP